MKFAKYKCLHRVGFFGAHAPTTVGECGKVFIAMSDRHRMDCCPIHNDAYVDMEEGYVRVSNAKFVEAFEPPWFDDEDDYHSALMGWLNDSDEEFNLEIYCGVLYVLRCDTPVVAVTDAQHNVSDHSKPAVHSIHCASRTTPALKKRGHVPSPCNCVQGFPSNCDEPLAKPCECAADDERNKSVMVTQAQFQELWKRIDAVKPRGKTKKGFELVMYAEVAEVLGTWIGEVQYGKTNN